MTKLKSGSKPVLVKSEVPAELPASIHGALSALRRAALRAREVAQQTGTDLIVVRSGQVVRVSPWLRGSEDEAPPVAKNK